MDVFTRIAQEARPYLGAAAAQAAHRLGVFAAIAQAGSAGAGVVGLAADLRLGARRLRALLDVLVLDGVLLREGPACAARYCNGPALPPALPAGATPAGGWGLLADALRADRPVDDANRIEALDPTALERFHRHLAMAGADAARALAARLLLLDPPAATLLDCGGGAGAYTAAFLDASPGGFATLVDRPQVIELARSALADRAARLALVAGDLFEVPLGEGYGMALLANLLHLVGPDDARRLVTRAAAALAPGGWLAVKDLAIAADRSGPPTGVLFALNMALYTQAGDVYDADQIVAWLLGAGLTDVTVETLRAAPDAVVILGRRPA